MNRPPHSSDSSRRLFPLFAALVAALALAACMASGGDSTDPQSTASPDAGDAAPAKADATGPSDADRGAGYVAARGCIRCHQSPDTALGILSGSTDPRPGSLAFPKNLTPDLETGLGNWSDRLILRAIRDGVGDDGAPLCSTMPHYVDMGDDEGAAIVAYLRALAPVHHVIPESRCGESHASADAGDATTRLDGGSDADGDADGAAPDASTCSWLAGPGTGAACHACGTRPCQANGCYGGYVCDTRTNTCHPAPTGCGALP